jgi:hypothetical protein
MKPLLPLIHPPNLEMPGILDSIWLTKRQEIVQSVDQLKDEFCPLIRAGWRSDINKTYPAGSAGAAPSYVCHVQVVIDENA